MLNHKLLHVQLHDTVRCRYHSGSMLHCSLLYISIVCVCECKFIRRKMCGANIWCALKVLFVISVVGSSSVS